MSGSVNLRTRTPRTSIIGSNLDRPKSAYDAMNFGDLTIDEKEPLEIHEEVVAPASKSVRAIEIWREMFLTSNGRDKALVSRL